MDCNKAGEAMLQYMEKRIKPWRAAALARHLLKCESCREYFTAFDSAAEYASAEETMIMEAPDGFEAAVMAQVRRMPVYHANTGSHMADVAIRVFWGVCAVILGIALSLMYHKDAVSAFLTAHPSLAALSGFWDAFDGFMARILEPFMNNTVVVAADTGSIVSNVLLLLFVVMLGTLLYVVRRGEQINT